MADGGVRVQGARSCAAWRARCFHNGSGANTLTIVIKFYDTQFHIGLDATQFVDLANFLATL